MIAVVMSVRNEADIIETTLRHYLGEGVDKIVISDGGSRDGTVVVIERVSRQFPGCIELIDALPSPPFYQEREMTHLVEVAGELGAEWVIPADADEFIYPTGGGVISNTLRRLPSNTRVLALRVWRHHDWQHREVECEAPQKVVFRWEPGTSIAMGQHSCSVPGNRYEKILDIRELKYRSVAHFKRKISDHLETMRPEMPSNMAVHVQQYRGADDDLMAKAWDEMMAVSTVVDPIPSTLGGIL